MRSIRLFSLVVFALVAAAGGYVLAKRLSPDSPQGRGDILAHYSAAIKDAPLDYIRHYRRGTVFQERRQYELALADYNEAVRLAPQALSVEQLGDRIYQSALPETRTTSVIITLRTARAAVLERLNRPEEAVTDLSYAIALDLRKSDLYFARGFLLLATGRHDAAISDFDTILSRRAVPQWSYSRGVAKYLKGDWPAARADFERALKQAPDNGSMAIWLAKAYLRAGEAVKPEHFGQLDRQNAAWRTIEAFMTPREPTAFVAGVRAGAGYMASPRQDRRCETALFLGEWLTIRAKGAGASEMFKEAHAACQPLSIERAVAAAELARLGAK